MPNIRILDEVLASKIAAGEVVERPASVIKELVENSIDAGATRIDIEVHNGGKSLMRVTDNGSGMGEKDARLCIERHATSKIKNADDLFNISTLGFRGEALPSIASVSRLELLTNDGSKGTKILIDGGKAVVSEETACPKGTSIIVKDIFFNTPARLKFLKSDPTEASHISDVVSKFVLSYPGTAFRLKINGKESVSSTGKGDLLDAVSSVYGSAFARSLVKVGTGKVRGYTGKPGETKINREYQTFFVNGRTVKNFPLSKALESAYSNLIPRDRHPVAVIFVDVDPKEVDVNVHPTKKEIKFAKQSEVTHAVAEAVRQALVDSSVPELISSPQVFVKDKKWTPQMERVWREGTIAPKAEELKEESNIDIDSMSGFSASAPGTSALYCSPSALQRFRSSALKHPVPVAQLDQTYIICVDGKDLVLVDQHAAHERILYEKLKTGAAGTDNSQCCLIPEVLELIPKEFIAVEQKLDALKELGFDIEVFGKSSVRVKAVPTLATKVNVRQLISDLAGQDESEKRASSSEDEKERLIKLTACHGAIKAGDPLSGTETEHLIKELYSTSNPSTCPHGRPSIVKLEGGKIAGFFDR